jgi:hypothetical protein
MTTSFDNTLKLAAKSIKLLPGAEYVTYIPLSGSRRKIQAVVTRNEADQIAEVQGGNLPKIEVLVENDFINGITSEQIDTGGDKIEMAERVDEKPVILRLVNIINHDAGFMLIEAS